MDYFIVDDQPGSWLTLP